MTDVFFFLPICDVIAAEQNLRLPRASMLPSNACFLDILVRSIFLLSKWMFELTVLSLVSVWVQRQKRKRWQIEHKHTAHFLYRIRSSFFSRLHIPRIRRISSHLSEFYEYIFKCTLSNVFSLVLCLQKAERRLTRKHINFKCWKHFLHKDQIIIYTAIVYTASVAVYSIFCSSVNLVALCLS